MKRVRTEQIQMAVACYLKRRQYVDSDGPLKPGLRLSQTPEEMAASLAGERGAPDSGVRATSLRAPRRRHAASSAHVTLRLGVPEPRRGRVLWDPARLSGATDTATERVLEAFYVFDLCSLF